MSDLALPSAPLNNHSPATPLSQLPLLVLVGVTGVGKSTALGALSAQLGGQFSLLPDRREVTDAVMILPLAGGPVTDRQQRFALTAQYREAHPGGMAQALGELGLRHISAMPLVFDGLRGLDEVRYAAQSFPAWRFVGLHAPDLVRVQRLLGRADQFDRVASDHVAPAAQQGPSLAEQLGNIAGISEVFTPAEITQLCDLQDEGHSPADIIAKTKIVVSERRNYDPLAAREYLQTLPPERFLDIDSHALGPAEVAAKLQEWL